MKKWFEKVGNQYREDLKTADEKEVLSEIFKLIFLTMFNSILGFSIVLRIFLGIKNIILHSTYIYSLIYIVIAIPIYFFICRLTGYMQQAFYDIRVIKDPKNVEKQENDPMKTDNGQGIAQKD